MTIEIMKAAEKRNVLVGIRFDGHTKELLDWALVKVADPGDRVVAVHVCRSSDTTSKDKHLLDDYLVDYEGLCNKKQVDLTAEVLKGCSIKKVLVREAKKLAAAAVIVGISKHSAIGGWLSIAKYCAKRLPPTIEVMAIHHGKVVFRSNSNSQLAGSAGDPKPSLYVVKNCTFKENQSEFGDSEISEMARLSHEVTHSSENGERDGSGNAKEETSSPIEKHKRGSLSSISLPIEDFTKQRPGWPLLRSAGSITQPSLEARRMSVVQWVMTLPNRPLLETQSKSNLHDAENGSERENDNNTDQGGKDNVSILNELPKYLEHALKINSPDFKRFSYDVLRTSTSQFSPENLIGRGGCNRVYKGILPEGKPVAVKIMKSSKEAWNNFTLEVDIMTTLKHQNITPLLGICVEDNDLISVYDFFSRGNLEENLHSDNTEKTALQWEVRFKIAVGIAEALNYLHNDCPRPIIHRDVKSSNILLTHDFEPQLSDFGLAIWGPMTAAFLTHSDVVGTFGYLAPEYFMYGKVSDKLDVYAFGVVLLELLSGRKPIGFESPKGQESLVMWAKPKLVNWDLESLMDPKLENNIDKDQMQRICLAAKLCLTQAARLRPKMNQILKILKGEKEVNEDSQSENRCDSENQDGNDDEVYPDLSAESHFSLALVDISDDNSPSYSTSFSSLEQSSPLSVEGYLKTRWSRSSSLD